MVIGESRSEPTTLQYGVPQRSVLGPVLFTVFQEYEEPVYSYSTYPDRRFSSRYHNILKMSPPFASSEGVSASGDRYQSDGV